MNKQSFISLCNFILAMILILSGMFFLDVPANISPWQGMLGMGLLWIGFGIISKELAKD